MESVEATCRSRDILSRPWLAFLVFCLPGIAIVASGSAHASAGWLTVIWTAALTIMGLGCVANAARCRRTHCYLTGPFFLAMAVVTLLYGLDLLRLGGNGWNLIGLTILIGAIALCCLPEMIWGRYRLRRAEGSETR